jgi:hypothetical protein
MSTNTNQSKRVPLGRVVCTPGVMSAIVTAEAHAEMTRLLSRHERCDWGEMSPDDSAANDAALDGSHRVHSAYHLTPTVRVWIITEADRSVTTILLPEEY